MKDYDYHRDAWPTIVRDCSRTAGECTSSRRYATAMGRVIEYGQGRELDEAAALEFRGATVAVYGNQNVTEGKSCG